MGQQTSKDQLLFQQVNYGNIEGIKALRTQGAGLEWIDSEGKTALIVACMNPQLYNVAKTLIELGANVNVYRPGRHAGTPLHHAAKRGLDQTVKLLLSHGANALIMNDDCNTPLDLARAKGFVNVVRAIESHLCLFAGWLREHYGPGFLERFAPQLLSRKVWVVVLPCGSRNLARPFKLELAIYNGPQDAQPSMTIQLWKANLEEPNFNQPDPAAIISDISKSTRIKLAPAIESEKHQLQRFCNACKGIPQVMHPSYPFGNQPPTAPPTAAASSAEDDELLAMAINASLQSVTHEGASNADTYLGSEASPSASTASSSNSSNQVEPHNKGAASGVKSETQQAGSIAGPSYVLENDHTGPSVVQPTPEAPLSVAVPSAPPASDADIGTGPIIYPSIDTSPIDLSSSTVDASTGEANAKEGEETTSSCTICLDAPLEGACVPCGHMAGCMRCLNEIKAKSWGCPVCRSKIDQIIRIYAV
ncbi:putative E3 ubiquitin-protein ligase XBAT34 [Salvia hispanica]|uniref:putative E3 ubiquitin-protein ligase XBAT34 n=1 Tax=Salvia hispanica TaxID=49212 RepID=UPI00200983E3|nr:putative E3 ubiquitin-protein ligase XBAT34 [Salvia hispanica]